jgi:hypothetical protein
MRVLLAGWFSFDEVIATVGDELGADVVARWLTDLDVDHGVAWAPYLRGSEAERVRAAGQRGREGNARARAWFEEQLAG